MSIAGIEEQYAQSAAKLPGGSASDAVRRAALACFRELGFPDRSVETWHYTDMRSVADQALAFVAAAPTPALTAAAAAAIEDLALDPDAPRCVFIDGHWIETLSSLPPTPALRIEVLADNSAAALLAHRPSDSALAALNTAFASSGALIRVSGAAARPLQLLFLTGRGGLAAQTRLRFELAPGASATAVQYFADLGSGSDAWLNLVTDADLGESSALTLYRLQQCGPESISTTLSRLRLADSAAFSAASIELGGKLVRNELQIELAGESARTNICGLALTRGRQHCDTRIAVEHNAAHTVSRQDYRAIATDRSRSIFNGKVTVQEDAQHIDARQRNDNLLLAATAEIDTKPELEIYADQVVCSHGATVGELSEEHLFYLRSRGIDAETARGILTTAFAEVILEQLGLDDFRKRARTAVQAVLPRRAEMD
jgi:Fe-S cluster assembly protein SufD